MALAGTGEGRGDGLTRDRGGGHRGQREAARPDPGRAFLTTGRQGLPAFAALAAPCPHTAAESGPDVLARERPERHDMVAQGRPGRLIAAVGAITRPAARVLPIAWNGPAREERKAEPSERVVWRRVPAEASAASQVAWVRCREGLLRPAILSTSLLMSSSVSS